LRLWLPPHQTKFGLADALPNPAKCRACRSYLCASGGHC
jgi:hypothetical protein